MSIYAKIKLLNKRQPKRKAHKKKDPILGNQPHVSGIVNKVLIQSPKKPNSANRKAVQVFVKVRARQKSGRTHIVTKLVAASIPGEGHSLNKNNKVLLQGKGAQDTGTKYSVVRGVGDDSGVQGRINGASKYGSSPKTNRAEAKKKENK